MRMKRYLLMLAAAIVLLVPSCQTTANHPPTIDSLEIVGEVDSSHGFQIECVASDKDGNELSYVWSASGGDIDVDGSTAIWIAPEANGIYAVSVEASDGDGGSVADALTITMEINHPPTIISLTADTPLVILSSSCQIECVAEDVDGDELRYEWSASEGDISGTSHIVMWTAPEASGICDITVKVTDDLGGEAIKSLSINVIPNELPIIEELIVTPDDPDYFKEYTWDPYRIYRSERCDIECVASDPEGDELSYKWSTDGGRISGEGSIVTWTAPREEGDVTITVTVSDSSGGIASKSILFRVECSKCLFR